MAKGTNVPSIDLVSKKLMSSSPCKDCQDRKVGCHGSCEKYKDFHERLRADRQKRREVYAPEKLHENYNMESKERHWKRMKHK